MIVSSHRILLQFLVGLAVGLPLAMHPVIFGAEQIEQLDGAGIIRFVGNVRLQSGKDPIIDLGDAHGLESGSEVAVFRAQEMHFRPLGTVRIVESFATWSVPDPSEQIELRDGDWAVYVRTLVELGTGEEFRDSFLRQQLVKTGDRNGYSTFLKQRESETLQRYISRHPRWVRDQRHFAGTIRGESVSRREIEDMQPLLRQVVQLQHYQSQGFSIEQTIGTEWEAVTNALKPVPDAVFGEPTGDKTGDAVNAASQPVTSAVNNEVPELSAEAEDQLIEKIRRETNRVLFTRSPEEQKIAVLLLTVIHTQKPRNEVQWFVLQLEATQFPSLAENVQFLDDLQAILKRIRNLK